MQNRRVILACVIVILAVALVGVARVRVVRSAQKDVLDTINQQIELFQVRAGRAVSVEQTIQDNASLQKSLNSKKMALSAFGTAGALAAAAVAAAACGTIAWFVGSARSVVFMGLWAWLVNGVAVGAIARSGTTGFTRLVQFPGFIEPREPPLGFTAYLVVGLASAFLWQSLLPAAAAGYLGLKLRAWWLGVNELAQGFEPGLVADPVANPASTQASRMCLCGAVNVRDRSSCYACGSSLRTAVDLRES